MISCEKSRDSNFYGHLHKDWSFIKDNLHLSFAGLMQCWFFINHRVPVDDRGSHFLRLVTTLWFHGRWLTNAANNLITEVRNAVTFTNWKWSFPKAYLASSSQRSKKKHFMETCLVLMVSVYCVRYEFMLIYVLTMHVICMISLPSCNFKNILLHDKKCSCIFHDFLSCLSLQHFSHCGCKSDSSN